MVCPPGNTQERGTRLFAVSGHVNRPGTYELPLGIPLRDIIFNHAGGMKDNKRFKAIIPGGTSCPILTADEIDVKMDFDSVAAIGSMLGSGGVVVMNEETCMVKALLRITKFYAHESCGQCTPCREGTAWLKKILQRVYDGEGRPEDLDNLLDIAFNMMGTTICPLAEAAAMPVRSFIQKFRSEFEYHVKEKAATWTGVQSLAREDGQSFSDCSRDKETMATADHQSKTNFCSRRNNHHSGSRKTRH